MEENKQCHHKETFFLGYHFSVKCKNTTLSAALYIQQKQKQEK